MALNIKDPETDRVARELAASTGETITMALRRAIEERLDRVRLERQHKVPDLQGIIERGRARLTATNSEDEILGYGPDGLPT